MRPTPPSPPSRPTLLAISLALLLALAPTALAQGQPSGSYGPLALGEAREGVLAPATAEASVYHTYTVEIPPGLVELTVAVDGLGNDVDLAFRFGAEIVAYQEGEVDFLDFSEEPNPSASVAGPPAGTLYIDVVNLIGQSAQYRLSVTAQGAAATPATPAPTGADPLVGTFAGDGVVLQLVPSAGGYQGQLAFQGQTYPVTAQAQGGALQGSFVAQGQAFPFEASPSGDRLAFRTGGVSYALLRQAAQAAPAQPAQPSQAAQPSGLEGRWTARQDFGFGVVVEQSWVFLPDGRYFYLESGEFPVQIEGRYQDGPTLTYAPYCDVASEAEVKLDGDQLTVTTFDFFGDPTTVVYTFEPGSVATVAQEVAALDAERAQFHARIPLGPAQPGAQAVDPTLPPDPNPQSVFAGATVFAEGELYTYFASYTYVFDNLGRFVTVNAADLAFDPAKTASLDYSRGEYRDQALWLLLSNGRAVQRIETYFDARDLSSDPVTPNVGVSWGRYRIENEVVIVETDAGERVAMELIGGRRQLNGDGICYGEVAWSTEELERQTRELE